MLVQGRRKFCWCVGFVGVTKFETPLKKTLLGEYGSTKMFSIAMPYFGTLCKWGVDHD